MDALRVVDEIEWLVDRGHGGCLGTRIVDEARFLFGVQRLRPLLSSSQSLQLVEELEHLVINSDFGVFGKRLVSEVEFFTKLQRLRSTLISESS